MPLVLHAGHETTEDTVALLGRNGQGPRVVILGVQRHFEFVPLAGAEVGADGGIIIYPGDTLLVAKRLLGLGVAGEGNDLGAITLFDDLVVERALLAADRLAAKIFPVLQAKCLRRHDVGAGGVVVRTDNADDLATVLTVRHGGDHQVDLALLEKLHAVR